MRTTRTIIIIAALFAPALIAVAGDAKKDRPDGVKIPPLHPFTPPKIREVRLPNSIRAFLVEDHELPTIDLRAIFPAGEAWDPADKVGLAELAADVLRAGGTEKHPEKELDKLLESRAMSIETSAGWDESSVSLSTLKEDQDLGLSLLVELLSSPRLPQDKLDQAKREALSSIERRNDEGPTIAGRVFPMTVFGKQSPLARETDARTIGAIGRDDVVAWHRKFVRPENMILAVWGDADMAELEKKLVATLGAWKVDGPSAQAPRPSADVVRGASWTLVKKEDVNQSAIVIGHAGGVRSPSDDDYPALVVMNEILGGGSFSSRLMKIVRSDEGLAYDVHSELGIDYDHLGTFELVCQTKSQTTVKAIKSLLREMKRLHDEPPTDEEVALAKEMLDNMLPLQVDETGKIVGRTLTYAYRRFPLDTLSRFREAVAKVTKDDVARVSARYLHPDAVRVVVVGNPADFDAKLETVAGDGKVEVVDDVEAWAHGAAAAKKEEKDEKSDEPAKKDEAAPAKKKGDDAGAKLLDDALEAMGGKKALASLDALELDLEVSKEGGPAIKVRQTLRFPDKIRIDMDTPAVVQAYDGAVGWVEQGERVIKLPASVAKQLKHEIEKEDISLFRAAARGEATVKAGESKDGATTLALAVADRPAVRYVVDDKSHRIVAKLVEQEGQEFRVAYSGHAALEGSTIIYPRKIEARATTADAKEPPAMAVKIVGGKANPKLDEKFFSPPPTVPKKKPDEKGADEKKDEKPVPAPKKDSDEDE